MLGRLHVTLIAALFAVWAQPTVAAGLAFDFDKINRAALERHIAPAYAQLQSRFERLQTATQACAEQPEFDFATLRPTLREAIIAWAGVAHITFGPVANNNRFERLFFWPDRKGIARRQVARALKSQPADYANPEILGKRSIGVQGLPAFELLVTQPTAPDQSTFKCAYAQSITSNLVAMARELNAAWQPGSQWTKHWLAPGPNNPHFLNAKEPTFALFRAFLTQIERVRDVELFRPLGLARKGRKLPGPFARSDLTMTYIAARLKALQSAVVDSGIVEETARVARQERRQSAVEEITEVRFELDYLVDRTARHAGIADFFATDRSQEATALGYPMKEIRGRAENAVAAVTDLPFGFNASDGD